MANLLTQKRRKCVKSPNIFRDTQEYSSLYTISSRSASSIHSEMSLHITKQNNQHRVYPGLYYKGDADTVTSGKSYFKNKYPKLPSNVSQELQQKVYSNAYKRYYNQRTQFIKSKFDNLSLENESPPFKPYCYPERNPPNQCMQSNNFRSVEHPRNRYAINRIEESYWAKWKPINKCEKVNYCQDYQNCAPLKKTNICCPKVVTPCKELSSQKLQLRKKCCAEKPLKIIHEPTEMRDSNSSDIGINKEEKKINRSCCPCQRTCVSKLCKSEPEVPYAPVEDETTEDVQADTSQEEYESLYNEVYQEYENDLMNKISEYEMEQEEREMRELERQLAAAQMQALAEQEAKEIVQNVKLRVEKELNQYDGRFKSTGLESNIVEPETKGLIEKRMEESDQNEEFKHLEQKPKDINQKTTINERKNITPNEGRKKTSQDENEKSADNERNTLMQQQLVEEKDVKDLTANTANINEYSEPEITILKHTDSFIINFRKQRKERPRKPQPKFLKLSKTFSPTVKGHTYPLKSVLKKELKKEHPQPMINYNRALSPVSPKSRSTTKPFAQPSYLMRH